MRPLHPILLATALTLGCPGDDAKLAPAVESDPQKLELLRHTDAEGRAAEEQPAASLTPAAEETPTPASESQQGGQ